MPQLPWIPVSFGVAAALAALAGAWLLYRRRRHSQILTEWALTTRPLFNPQERLCFRLLRDALPHHLVLAKVPLVRFCRPVDQSQVRYWHELLGSIYVSFVVCAPNGRVLAALDIDSTHRAPSRRVATIKQEVLQACGIRYVKCRAEQFPSVAELQMLVPHQGLSGRAAVPDTVDSVRKIHATLAHTVRARRPGQPVTAWGDSTIGSDSFFTPDSRIDDFVPTDPASSSPGPLSGPQSLRPDAATRPAMGPGIQQRPHVNPHSPAAAAAAHPLLFTPPLRLLQTDDKVH